MAKGSLKPYVILVITSTPMVILPPKAKGRMRAVNLSKIVDRLRSFGVRRYNYMYAPEHSFMVLIGRDNRNNYS